LRPAVRQEAAAPFNLPVMIHVGQNYSLMRAILAPLRRGDIVTHMYAPGMNDVRYGERRACVSFFRRSRHP
jgi:predicted amidohydrolase